MRTIIWCWLSYYKIILNGIDIDSHKEIVLVFWIPIGNRFGIFFGKLQLVKMFDSLLS
jgi:hypothetical protein